MPGPKEKDQPAKAKPQARSGLQKMPNTAPAMRSPSGDMVVTRGGKLQRLACQVTLKQSEKHIYTIDGGKTFTIQGEGYTEINKQLGMRFVLAPDVVVNGMIRQNPYVELDPVSGRIREVYVCAALVGRAENGAPITLVETLNFSPDDYFRSELVKHCGAKSTWNQDGGGKEEAGFSDHGRLVALASINKDDLEEHQVLYAIDEEVGALINLNSSKVTEILQTRQENLKFATRKAQTMLFRRLCAKHPALPSQHISGDRVVCVWEYKPGRDADPVRVVQSEKPSRYAKMIDAEVTINVLSWVEMPGAAAETDMIVAALRDGDRASLELVADQVEYYTARDNDEVIEKVRVLDVDEDDSDDQDPDNDAPFTKEQMDLSGDCNRMLAQLRKKKGGARQAAELVQTCVDPDLPFEEQDPADLNKLKTKLQSALGDDGSSKEGTQNS